MKCRALGANQDKDPGTVEIHEQFTNQVVTYEARSSSDEYRFLGKEIAKSTGHVGGTKSQDSMRAKNEETTYVIRIEKDFNVSIV